MKPVLSKSRPVLFLGVADYVESPGAPFPIGGVDLFQLSQCKFHIIYPATIQTNEWVLLVRTDFIAERDLSKWKLRIADQNDIELVTANFTGATLKSKTELESKPYTNQYVAAIPSDSSLTILYFKIDIVLSRPGKYTVHSIYDGKSTAIGSVHFYYQKAPPLTADRIKALESDPNSARFILLDLGCKHCPTKLNTYTGLSQSSEFEAQGYVWQSNLQSEFTCECGRTKYSLDYLKESFHGLLLKDFSRDFTGLSYVRRYGHSQVVNVVKKFTKLLDRERLESPVQQFMQQNPILLSRFRAKRLFFKPDIVGRFQADFAVVDSDNQLWFIELEKPSLKLFKKNGHPTQYLMHAYEQVNDWLDQYDEYRGAILDRLNLK